MVPKAEKKPVTEKAPAEKKPEAEKKLPKESSFDKKKKRWKKNVETYKIYIFKLTVSASATLKQKSSSIEDSEKVAKEIGTLQAAKNKLEKASLRAYMEAPAGKTHEGV